MLTSCLQDVHYAARRLRRAPVFTLASVLTFAIGIGATTAVFGVLYAVLVRPLPFPRADRLVQIVQLIEPPPAAPTRAPSRGGLSEEQLLELEQHSQTLAAVGRYQSAGGTLTDIPLPVRLNGARVSVRLFDSLGVRPILGRLFAIEDEQPGAAPIVLLSHGTWTRHFGGRPDVVDRYATLNQVTHRIVGVMPRGFGFPSLASATLTRNSEGELDDAPEFWLPAARPTRSARRGGFSLFAAFGVLRDGVTIEQARGEIAMRLPPLPDNRRPALELVDARVELGRRVRPALVLFQFGVLLILAIAGVNVTNFFLTRAAHRRRELAIRVALGAGTGRVIRDAVAECLLLSGAGAALGCLLAYALTRAVRVVPPHVLPRAGDVRLDAVVLLFALGLSVALGVAVGVFSGRRASRASDPRHLGADRSGGLNALIQRRLRPSRGLVVVEIAATTILLVCSGLLIDSFVRILRIDPGFDTENVLSFRVTLPAERYRTTDAQETFYTSLAGALAGVPGVDAVAASNAPLQSGTVSFDALTAGAATHEHAAIAVRQITPGYFRALGTPFRAGRDFAPADRTPTASRAIVNDAFARTYLGTGDRVGQRLAFSRWRTLDVIGVVGDVRPTLFDEPRPTLYLLADNDGGFPSLAVFVRTTGQPLGLLPAIRAAIRHLDLQLALVDPMSLEQMIRHAAASPRLFGIIALWCGAIALTLAIIGLAGLLTYSVGLRAREIAIRMALGADALSIRASVVRDGVLLTCVGLAAGGAGAYFLSRHLEAMLFGVTVHDPAVFAGLPVVLLLAAALTSYGAACRATSVDPIATIRAE